MTQRPLGAGVPPWLPDAVTVLRVVLVPVFLFLLFLHPQ
jgi:phosphatidylglycerophosphate synthase